MDFNFTENQTMVRDLARGILEKEVTPERVKAQESSGVFLDRPLWTTLAEAGLIGLAVSEEDGGMGMGILELCTFLEELGRVVAAVPAMQAQVWAGLPIAELGTPEQKKRWLAPLAAGEVILTAALDSDAAASVKKVTAKQEDGGWSLTGQRAGVAAADIADAILVPAVTDAGVGLFIVESGQANVSIARANTSSGEGVSTVSLDGAFVEDASVLVAPGDNDALLSRIVECALVANCALQVGISSRALEMTAAYTTERVQFGVPIGSFQAVQHRAADGYIDLEAMRWSTWRAAWHLAEGLPAYREAAVAKFWAAEGGSRIASSAQHLHAGIGVDIDYPIHRYFLRSKSCELTLGSAAEHLALLGRDMARTGPQELS